MPVTPASVGKDTIMWVFDGETWTEEGSETHRKPETALPRYEEMMPELQVIEVVVPVTRHNPMPPFPLP